MKSLAALPLDLLRALAVVLGFAAAATGLAAWGGAFSPTLDALTHFAPVGFALAVVAGVLALVTPRRHRLPATAAVVLIGLLAWGGLMGPDIARRLTFRPAAGAETIKIVQFNVLAFSGGDREKLAWIRSQDPDFVVLEETYGATQPLLDGLAAAYPYRTADDGWGVTILSKRPPVAQRTIAGAVMSMPWTWARYPGRFGDITLMAAHLVWPFPPGPQAEQLGQIAGELRGLDRPNAILAGDFNSTPWSFALRRFGKAAGLERRTHALPTWPASVPLGRLGVKSPTPFLAIDQVFAGSRWSTVSVRRGPSLGSDHRPVVVVLTRDAA